MKKNLLLLLCAVSAMVAMAQDDSSAKPNYFETSNSLIATQFANKNWADGGGNSFSGRATSYVKHVYTKDKFDVTTFWDAAYAGNWQDSLYTKTEDRFRINSALNYGINDHFFYNLSLDVASQFTASYGEGEENVVVSKFGAPLYLNLGLGINYKYDDARYVIFSPLTGALTAVLDDKLSNIGAFGVTPGKKTLLELGMSLNVEWEQPLFKNISDEIAQLSYRTSFQSFWNYQNTPPSMNWQSWIILNVYKYFDVNLNWTVIYNDKITTPSGSGWQFSESLGVGLSYKFKSSSK